MKIAQITSTFPPYKGGIGQVAYNFSKYLAKRGHEVTVFVSSQYKKSMESEGFKIKRLKSLFGYGNAAFIPQLLWSLKKYEVVHLHFPFFGGAEVVWLLKKIKGKKMKLVITYHMDVVGSGLLGLFFKIYSKIITPLIIKSADRVSVSSRDYLENSLIKKIYQKNYEKFVELPFGADPQFKPEKRSEEFDNRYGINKGDKVILFVGGLDRAHYFKGVGILIGAFQQILRDEFLEDKVKLLIVGGGELKKIYERLVFQIRLGHKVVFTGRAGQRELVKYYNLADLVVLPSLDKSEAFGIVLIEAMASAKPVIASNLVGVRTVVLAGVNGYLTEPADVCDLAQKIKELLKNPERAREFGLAGRKKVEEKYNWDRIINTLERIYKECLW